MPSAVVDAATGLLTAYLPGRRWFGAKGRSIARVVPLEYAAVPGAPGLLAIFRVEFSAGEPARYVVPIRDVADRPDMVDALEDPAFSLVLIEHIREQRSITGQRGAFRFARSDAFLDVLPGTVGEIVRVGVEQSNTSLIADGKAILKVWRRLELGPNPELEITRFLTDGVADRLAPRLLGSIVYDAPDEESSTVAVLHEYVPNQGDAWTVVLSRLADYYASAAGPERGTEAPDPAFARALAAADAKEARSLGELTGRLHMALAAAPTESSLAAEPITRDDVTMWRDGMVAQLERAMGALAAARESLPPDVLEVGSQLLQAAPRLREAFGALETLVTEPVAKIRVHGDYHLGQVLWTTSGFVVVDFEGEPARPLAERRAKHCPLKDVAGMLRSFAYAAHAGLLRAGQGDGSLLARMAPWAEEWQEAVSQAFLSGYLARTWERGASFLPRRRETLDAVLRVFELDKAVYELLYEIDHRPTWVRIPLERLRRVVSAPPAKEPAHLARARESFEFVACLEVREFVGARADDERQLAELIEQVPLDSIYYHTHGFFLRHKFVAGIYPNDFATWVSVHARDQVLGERLAMVDPTEFADLEMLREEMVAIIDDHLRQLQFVPRALAAEPFDFVRSRIVEIPTGVRVDTLSDFRHALLEVDASAIYFHLVESRMRLGRGQNDFAAWLERSVGLAELAGRVRAVNPYVGSLERTRARLIQLCDDALREGPGR